MRRALVIGCNSLELTAGGITVHRAGGAEAIAWRDVTAAALAGQERLMIQMAEAMTGRMEQLRATRAAEGIGGDLVRKAMEMRETHDPLLIVHRSGVVHALIEQSGPEREALLAGLRANLGDRWLGEEFTSQQLEQRFGAKSSGCSLRGAGCVAALIGGLLLVLFGWILVTAVPIATAEALGDALMAGDWKAALIACAVLAVTLVVVWLARSAAGYIRGVIRSRLK